MNNKLLVGFLLQIPNLILMLVFGIMFLTPYLTMKLLGWVVVGTMYGLVNIASIILLIVGLFSKND